MEFRIQDKVDNMMRAYTRLKKINTNNGNSISNTEARDATEEFFNQCYHLKDWLKKDTSLPPTKIEDFISSSKSLSLACDLCNSFKHAGLDNPPRSGKHLERINTHVNFDLGSSGFIASARAEVTFDGEGVDTFVLATNCIKDWNLFFRENGVIVNILDL